MRISVDFIFHRQGESRIWVDPEFALEPPLKQIADPDILLAQNECAIIKDQNKIKVGCVDLLLADRRVRLYIKRFNAFSWRYRLGSLVIQSGATRSLRGAMILREAGIRTARPIAAIEKRRCGMLTGSFYLSEEIANGKISTRYWCEDLRPLMGASGRIRRRAFVRGLAGLFERLHAGNVYHNDLKDFNILVAPEEKTSDARFFLLDLEGVRRVNRLSRRRRIKNLVQLHRSLGKFVSRTDLLRFLTCYLGAERGVTAQLRTWVRAILEQSHTIDRQKLSVNSGTNVAPGGVSVRGE